MDAVTAARAAIADIAKHGDFVKEQPRSQSAFVVADLIRTSL
ncbi:MAG TPA: hypothetical protein VMU22_06630 [Rhizomicrobium sp.]|nr:hypothetical protein [Rhizomicrobium sp.]